MKNPHIRILYRLFPFILFIFLNRVFLVTQNQTLLTAARIQIVRTFWGDDAVPPGGDISLVGPSSSGSMFSSLSGSHAMSGLSFSDDLGIYKEILQQQSQTNDPNLSLLRDSLGSRTDTRYDFNTLQQIFARVQTPQVGQVVFLSAMTQHKYADAFAYRQKYGLTGVPDVPAGLLFRMLVNAPLMGGSRADQAILTNTIDGLFAQGRLLPVHKTLYQTLLLVLDGKFQQARDGLRTATDPDAVSLRVALEEAIKQRSQYPNVPDEYLLGLHALAMMKTDYYKMAQILALRVVAKIDYYILPYQILAYTNFVMNNWSESRSYYLSLMSKDQENVSKYAFFLGISSYWLGMYTDAIIYLKQAKIDEYQADTLQYLLLAYRAIDDDTNTMRTFESLLTLPKLSAVHFRLFFDFVFFEPYANSSPFTVFTANAIVVSSYLDTCFRVLSPAEQAVCMYGQAGVSLARGNSSQAGKILKDIANVYQYSYVYRAIGDRYVSQKDRQNARVAYVRSLAMTASPTQQQLTKQKLFSLFPYLVSSP